MRVVDFSLAIYEDLCASIRNAGFSVYTVARFIREKPLSRFVVLRHDVEYAPKRALDMVRIEYEHGLNATYCFRYTTRSYNPGIMREIERLGHEIGYHYETLDRCSGDHTAAVELFKRELAVFREDGFDILTVCSHGNPRVKKVGYERNLDIFKGEGRILLQEAGLLGEAYLGVNSPKLAYLSDSGRKWRGCSDTREIIEERLGSGEGWSYYVLVHPDWWRTGLGAWIMALVYLPALRSLGKPLKQHFWERFWPDDMPPTHVAG